VHSFSGTPILTLALRRHILPGMKRHARQLVLVVDLVVSTAFFTNIRAETETIDLKALAKKARPAVMLLVVSDANGKEIATGTGFLVSSDGKLITNHHVIENAASAVAKAENGGLFLVEGVLADDPKNDLVLLKLKGKDLPFLPLGSSEKVEAGTRVVVIGSPLGLEGTLSEGIVSAIRDLIGEQLLLQITAAISPGSSGSPVLNARGEVIGIATALLHGGQSLNFAVPVETAKAVLLKALPSGKPQALTDLVSEQQDKIRSDPDWRAAVAAQAAGDYVQMLKHAQSLVRRCPEDALAHYGLGVAYLYLKFNEDAMASLQQSIKFRRDYAAAWNNLGVAYGKLGRTEEEIAAYQQAIKLEPEHPDAWNNLGTAFGDVGRVNDEISAYRQAIKIRPEYAEAWHNLGVAYTDMAQRENALEILRQLRKIDSKLARKLEDYMKGKQVLGE
jgi:tetratricopeptide (TPR) repeat protein